MALCILSQSTTQNEVLEVLLFYTEDVIANVRAVCYNSSVAP